MLSTQAFRIGWRKSIRGRPPRSRGTGCTGLLRGGYLEPSSNPPQPALNWPPSALNLKKEEISS
jgi:hypothetical protein